MSVFVLAFLRFCLVVDVGAAHVWELVGNCLEISWGSLGCAWPSFRNYLGVCGNWLGFCGDKLGFVGGSVGLFGNLLGYSRVLIGDPLGLENAKRL